MAPHGMPDWGLVGPKDIVYGLDDLGEQAVRLGSPHLWDRRGDALYLTDFRDGLGACQIWGNGTGHEEALNTGAARQSAYDVRLRAGSDGQQRAWIQLAMPFQNPSCVGLEFSFSVAPKTWSVDAHIGWYNGTDLYEAIGGYDHTISKAEWLVHPGVWLNPPDALVRHECIRAEHTMKLVVDMTTNQYVRLMIDEKSYDLRSLNPVRTASVFPPYWYFFIYAYGVATFNPDIFIDNVIVTQNEP